MAPSARVQQRLPRTASRGSDQSLLNREEFAPLMPFLRQVFIFLIALAALAIMLMMMGTAKAAEPNQEDSTRQIVVERTTQDKGAASTDLTAESGAVPVQTLASDEPAPAEPSRTRLSLAIAKRSPLPASMCSISPHIGTIPFTAMVARIGIATITATISLRERVHAERLVRAQAASARRERAPSPNFRGRCGRRRAGLAA